MLGWGFFFHFSKILSSSFETAERKGKIKIKSFFFFLLWLYYFPSSNRLIEYLNSDFSQLTGKSPVSLLCKFRSWFRSLGNIWVEFKDLLLWCDCLVICWRQQVRKNLTQANKSSCICRSTYKLCSCIKVYRLYWAIMCSSQYYTTEVSRPSLSNSNSQMTLNWCN